MLRALLHDLIRLFGRSAARQDVDDELRAYFDSAVDEGMRGGLTREAAERAARLEFGNAAVARDTALEGGWTGRFHTTVESIRQDVRYGLRYHARAPFVTMTMILTLAIGIGTNTALFTVVRSEVRAPVQGVPHDAALVRIRGTQRYSSRETYSREIYYQEFLAYGAADGPFASIAGETGNSVVIDPGNGREISTVTAQHVTTGYFGTLGVRPIMGPGLPTVADPSASGAEPAAVIGFRLWRDEFGAATNVVGRVITLNDHRVRIVGVAPERFTGIIGHTSGLWLPLAAKRLLAPASDSARQSLDSTYLTTIARLRPGATMEQATAMVRVVAARHLTAAAARSGGTSDIVPLFATNVSPSPMHDNTITAAALGGLNLLILLIICTNVSSLLVGRALTRRREIGLRLSLGAPRRRIVRQLLTESAMIAVSAGVLGLIFLWWLVNAYGYLMDQILSPDGWTVLFTVVFALGTTLLFGLSPALHASRASVSDALKESATGAGSRSKLQRKFVIAQVALTQPLLVGLAALLTMVAREMAVRPRFDLAEHVAHLRMVSVRSQTQGDAIKRTLTERLATVPGVEMISKPSVGTSPWTFTIHAGDEAPGMPTDIRLPLNLRGIEPDYLRLMDLTLARGRWIEALDLPDAPRVIVIGSDAARAFWGDADPLGRRLDRKERSDGTPTTYTVVGVIDLARSGGNDDTHSHATDGSRAFAAQAQYQAYGTPSLLIRTTGPASALLPNIRAIVREAAPTLPIAELTTLAAEMEKERTELIQISGATAGGALIALLLASLGLYAAVAFGVGQRTREIGIRMALGARQSEVVALFFAGGLRLGAIGMLIGLPLSVACLRILMIVDPVYSVNVFMLGAFVATTVVAVAALATWLPARRAAAVDPMISLRTD